MIVYDSPGLTPDFSDGLISFTECCNETCVYCTTMEYGESAHTLPESIVMKFDQVLGRSANNIVLAKKDMEYFYHYTILNIPELQKAGQILKVAFVSDLNICHLYYIPISTRALWLVQTLSVIYIPKEFSNY